MTNRIAMDLDMVILSFVRVESQVDVLFGKINYLV